MVKSKTSEPRLHPEPGPLKSFRNLMTFRLHMVARLSERVSEDYYRQRFDLSLPECRVIGITGGYGTVSFKKVAKDTYLEKSYASRVVSILVDRGIIEKLENPADSRSVLLRLTPHGMTVHDEMHQAAIRLNDWLALAFEDDQIENFTKTLSAMEGRLENLSATFGEVDQTRSDAPRPAALGGGGDIIQLDRTLAESLSEALKAQLRR